MLLAGVCRLTFEGQTFVPDGGVSRQCWLEVTNTAREQLSELLGPDWVPEVDEFQAEFWGAMHWTPDGCGHFGMFGSFALMDEVVSAKIIPPAMPSQPRKKVKSLREALRAGRAHASLHQDLGQGIAKRDSASE